MLAELVSSETLLLHREPSHCVLMWQKGALRGSFIRTQIPSCGFHPHDLTTYPKVPSPNTIALVVRYLKYECGWDTNIHFIATLK